MGRFTDLLGTLENALTIGSRAVAGLRQLSFRNSVGRINLEASPSGNFTVTLPNFTGIALARNSNGALWNSSFVIPAIDAANGGLVSFGYGGNFNPVVGGNSTWNNWAVGSNYQIYRVNSSGQILIAVDVSESGVFSFNGLGGQIQFQSGLNFQGLEVRATAGTAYLDFATTSAEDFRHRIASNGDVLNFGGAANTSFIFGRPSTFQQATTFTGAITVNAVTFAQPVTIPDLTATALSAGSLAVTGRFDFAAMETDAALVGPMGRLTLSNTDPIGGLSAGISNATAIQYLPYTGNLVPVFNNNTSRWRYVQLSSSGLSLSITGNPQGVYDVFLLNSSGQLTVQAWNNDTTRNISLTYLNGLLVGVFAAGVRPLYLGTIRLTGTAGNGRCHDNSAQRFVWNAYNQTSKFLRQLEVAASWTYNSSTTRPWNNSTANRVEVVCGDTTAYSMTFIARIQGTASLQGLIGLGIDSTTTYESYAYGGFLGDLTLQHSSSLSAGYHYIQAVEAAFGGTVTFGSAGNYGLKGTWLC